MDDMISGHRIWLVGVALDKKIFKGAKSWILAFNNKKAAEREYKRLSKKYEGRAEITIVKVKP